MMDHNLTQPEFEELSAWMDGELGPRLARQVELRTRQDARWRDALSELHRLDALLDAWEAPEPAGDLAERIIQAPTRRHCQTRALRWVRTAAPLAAAAAAVLLATVLAIFALRGDEAHDLPPIATDGSTPVDVAESPRPGTEVATSAAAEVDELIVEHLEFFENYDLIANLETLEAIEELQRMGS